MPRIVLVHALTLAMEPIRDAFARDWPQAELVNLLDDSLPVDRAAEANLSPAISDRIRALARYGQDIGADAVLFTCSAFGPAIEQAAEAAAIPVLKPNEAMFEAALEAGDRIGMLATFAPSVATMEAEFRHEARRLGRDAGLRSVVVPGAMEALRAGERQEHHRRLAHHAAELGDVDAIMLAQFSMAGARDAVHGATSKPVLTSPDAAVAKLKALLADGDG